VGTNDGSDGGVRAGGPFGGNARASAPGTPRSWPACARPRRFGGSLARWQLCSRRGGEERSPAGLRRGGLSAAMFESLLCIALQLAPTKCGGWRSQRCRGDNSILRDFCQLIEQQSNIVPPSGIIWSFIFYREKTYTEHVSKKRNLFFICKVQNDSFLNYFFTSSQQTLLQT